MPNYSLVRARHAVIVAAFLSSSPLLAHGWITEPPSRQDYCSRAELPFDCGALQWEPQSVEAPKGAKTCSGGSSFSILDTDAEWPAVRSNSSIAFKWKLTAAHRTKNWLYYVDGKLVKTIDGKILIPTSGLVHTLDGLKAGPTLFSVCGTSRIQRWRFIAASTSSSKRSSLKTKKPART